MEASQQDVADPFAEEPGSDPFAEEEAPAAGGAPAVEEPPVVDREGQPVAGEPQEAPSAPESAPPAAQAAAKPEAAPEAAHVPRGTRRLYKLLYQTDKGQWAEAPLSKWAESDYVVSEDGDHWIESTNAEQVRRLGYVFFQRPADGITLLPVAKGAWKPMRVKAKLVPTRERLEFESA